MFLNNEKYILKLKSMETFVFNDKITLIVYLLMYFDLIHFLSAI